MDQQLHNNLISTIREKIPQGKSMVHYLAEKLSLGRESVYRRIRGEIYFTFKEIAILALDLGFSIDNIVGARKSENALFNIHMLHSSNYFEIYVSKIREYGKILRKMSDKPNNMARISVNTLPFYFHVKYENLSRFRIYKWLHQNQKIGINFKFKEFSLPKEVLDAHNSLYQDIQLATDITVIMDNNIFWSVAKDIEYFLKRGLLSENDLHILQKELLDIVDTLEETAITGVGKNGAKVSYYISLVDLEASYVHLECNDEQFSQVRVFSISAIDSYDERLCHIIKDWIDSLKKYSVLISGSGEIQRFEYMNKQRGYINKIPLLDP